MFNGIIVKKLVAILRMFQIKTAEIWVGGLESFLGV